MPIEEMQQKGLAALSFDASARTPAHCDHLQRAHQRMQKGRMTERALQLFARMQQQGRQLNVITYIALMYPCGEGSMTKKALQRFYWMLEQGRQPSVITYDGQISACKKAGSLRGPCCSWI